MVVRRRRKLNKLRGNRTHGKGDTKNKRGAGCRGGRGRAGSHKHKYSKYWATFGQKITLKPKAKGKSINLDELSQKLQQFLNEGKIEKRGTTFVVDGKKIGYDKLLGRGNISEKIIVINMKVSDHASEKIFAAGGKVLESGEKVDEELETFEDDEENEEIESEAVETNNEQTD